MSHIPGITVILSNRAFIVPPLTLGALETLQQKIGSYQGGVDPQAISTTIDAAYAAIKRNYPEITRAELAELIDLGNMQEIWQAVMDVSGLRRQALEAQDDAGKSTGVS